MAIDETITRPKSMSASTRSSSMTEHDQANQNFPAPERLSYHLARKNRIERWVCKGRSTSISDTAATASATLGRTSAQKRSESTHFQAGRILNIRLFQLSEQRQKIIERNNFDQKFFVNKQALKYKDNQAILRTLSYVRKCCKYVDENDDEKDKIDPAIFLEENSTVKRSRSRSPSATPPPVKRTLSANSRTQTSASMAETFLRHNKKHLGSSSPISRKLTESKMSSYTPTTTNINETSVDDDSQKRRVQFRINNDGTHVISQSAHVISKSDSYNPDKQTIRNIATAHGTRSTNSSNDARISNSAPPIRTITSAIESTNENLKQSTKSKRSLSRISSAKHSMEEFRLHPERFLSASNRYLPLLRRQALEIESRELYIKQQKDKNDLIRRRRMNFSPPMSRLSDGSDLTYDDAKSFLSEENEIGKYTPLSQQPLWLEKDRKTNKKCSSPNKIDIMKTVDDEQILERRRAISRLRDREYDHLNELIRSNPIEQILEPFSAIKTDEDNQIDIKQENLLNYKQQSIPSTKDQLSIKPIQIRQLRDILQSIDSLRCSDTIDKRALRQVDIEKNRAKLGILIF